MKTAQPLSKKDSSRLQINQNEMRILPELLQLLKSIPANTEEAKHNETSMSDNNGKRIIYTLTEDMLKDK